MEQPNAAPVTNPNPTPTQEAPNPPAPQPTPAQPAAPAPSQPLPPATPTKSSSPWPWIVGGCLSIVVILSAVILFLGWWGIREAKKAVNEQIDKSEIQDNIDRLNKEGEAWQKKSENLRENMPNPDDFPDDLQNGYPDSQVKTKK